MNPRAALVSALFEALSVALREWSRWDVATVRMYCDVARRASEVASGAAFALSSLQRLRDDVDRLARRMRDPVSSELLWIAWNAFRDFVDEVQQQEREVANGKSSAL